MMTIDDVLERLHQHPDRRTLETYIAHAWVRPIRTAQEANFEEIDIARVQLVHHLHHELMLSEDAMDIVLLLLDQLYSHRERLRRLRDAIECQPEPVRKALYAIVREGDKP